MRRWKTKKSKSQYVMERQIGMYCDVLTRVSAMEEGYERNIPRGTHTVSTAASARYLWVLEFGSMEGFYDD